MEDEILDETSLDEQEQAKPLASFWSRVGASVIDFLIFIPLVGISVYNNFGWKSLPLYLILTGISITYKPLLEWKYGATWGKMAMNLKVVNYDWGAISLQQSFVRFSLYLAANVTGIVATIALFSHPRFAQATGFMEVSQLQNETQSPIGMILSLLVLISILMVAFTSKKQALHDMMAKTYCIKTD